MNKVYKVIWSKVRNCYMVVSELAKRNGRNTGTTDKRRRVTTGLAMAAMAVALNLGTMGTTEAGNIFLTSPNTSATARGSNALAGGEGAVATGNNSIAVGTYVTTTGGLTQFEAQVRAYETLQQLIKRNSFLNNSAVRNATNYGSLSGALIDVIHSAAYSDDARATANDYLNQLGAIVTSLQTRKGDGAIAVGDTVTAANTNAIAIGKSFRSFPQNGLSSPITSGAWGPDDIAIGTDAAAHGERVSEITGTILDGGGYYTETGTTGRAIAIGYHSQALREYTVAVGEQAMATGKNSLAMGHGARALTPGSIAIGGEGNGTAGVQQGLLNTAKDTTNNGGYSITIGRANNFTTGYDENDNYFANTKNSIAIGYHAHTHAANAFAIGVSTDATAERAFAVGTTSTSFQNTKSHQGTRASGQGSIAFGDTATVFVKDPTIADIKDGDYERATNTKVNDAIAVGTNSLSQARNAVSLGGGMSYTYHEVSGNTMTNITKYFNGSSWVDRAEGTGANIGEGADGAVAIGGATGEIDYGSNNSYFPTSAPYVSDYTAAATIGKHATRAVAVGSGALVGGGAINSVAVGERNVVFGINSTAVGQENRVNSDPYGGGKWYESNSLAAGTRNVVYGINSTAIGQENQVFASPYGGGKWYEGNSLAVGTRNIVTGANSTAVGQKNQVAGSGSGVFGDPSYVAGDSSYSFGHDNTIGKLEFDSGYPPILMPDETTKDVFVVGGDNKIAEDGNASHISVVGSSNSVKGTGNSENSSIIGISNSVTNKLTNSLIAGNSNNGLEEVDNSQIIGNSNTTGGKVSNLVVLGNNVTVAKDITSAVSIGEGSVIGNGAHSAVSIGKGTTAGAENSTALGTGAAASLHGSVALGSSSATSAGTKVKNAALGGITFGDFAGQISDSNRVVSVGSSGAERQIQNVAAGRISTTSTDAVNGSQLYAVADQLQWQVGVGADGGTNTGGALAQSTVGKPTSATDKSNVLFIAGEGIDISSASITNGYGIKVSLGESAKLATDDRNVGLIKTANGKQEITSPYIHVDGVEEAAAAINAELAAFFASPEYVALDDSAKSAALADKMAALRVKYNFANAAGPSSIAIGAGAATDDGAASSVAVGEKNRVSGASSTAVGQRNQVAGVGSGAFGSGTGTVDNPAANAVSGDNSYAVGHDNKIGRELYKDAVNNKQLLRDGTTSDVFVVGGGNKIAQQMSDAGASSINVFGSSNIIQGKEASNNSSIIGNDNQVYSKLTNSLIAGNSNKGLEEVDNSQIIGNSNTIGKGASNLVVLGNKATVGEGVSSSVSIGEGAQIGTKANSAVSIGAGASVAVAGGVALGSSSVAARSAATAAGYDAVTGASYAGSDADSAAWKSTMAAISVGGNSANGAIGQAASATRQITGVAAGSADTDAVNVAQLKVLGTAVKTVEKTAASATDNRNVGFITNAEGRQEITSPYLHVEGVEEAARKFNDDLASYMSSSSYTSLADADKAAALTAKMAELRDKYNFANAAGMSSIAIGQKASATKYSSLAVGPKTEASGEYSTSVGYLAKATKNSSLAVGLGTEASGEYSTAVGYHAKATGWGSIALGYGSRLPGNDELIASGGYSTAIGRATKATGTGSTALGSYTKAIGENSTAMGNRTRARGRDSTAFGYDTEANGEASTAFGYKTHARGNQSTAFGGVYELRVSPNSASGTLVHAWGKGSTAFGAGTWADGDYSTAFGALTTAEGKYSTAFGGAYLYYPNGPDSTEYTPVPQGEYVARKVSASGDYSTAFGAGSWALGDYSTAFGVLTKARGKYSTAFGNASDAAGDNSLAALGGIVTGNAGNSAAIGKDAKASLPDTVSLGSGSHADRDAGSPGYDSVTGTTSTKDDATWKATKAAISIGDSGKNITRQITGVAAGSADTDAVNVAQLKLARFEVKAGDNISVLTSYGSDGHLIYTISGMKGGAVDSDDRVVTLTPTTPDNKDEKSITSPYLHFNGLDKAATADYAQAKADDSIAMGRSATAGESARRGIAIGKNATVHGEDTVALGPNAQASNRYAVALGADTKASIPTSVALGSQSVTTEKDTAGFYSGRVGYDVATDTTYRGADRYDSTWQSTDGSVSVGGGIDPYTGTPAMTRRISNVAAGVYDTDVVNVAQLKRVTLYKTDYRSTAIGTDAEGNTEITSPYINVHGVKEAAEAKTLLNVYKTYESYETTLAKNIQTLTIEKKDLTRDVNTLASRISDVDAKMKALTDPNSEAYKTLADEKAYLVGEHTTLSSELKEITEELSETEARLGTAAEDYKKAQELVDSQARAEGKDSVAVGSKSVASGDQTIAMGTDNAITGNLSTAVGAGNTVTGEQSIAVGTGHEVHGNNSGVFGDPTIINADNSYSVGNNNTIGGQSKEEDVKLNNVFIIGNESSVDTSDTFVLGSNVTKTAENSVFLGNKAAYVEEGKTTAGMSDYSSETINGKTYHFAGGKPAGVVSVGNENETRRIQNVAAGKISADSTDAINGSQLYSAIENVNTNLGDQISNVDSRATKGIAGAAALAALHPLDFDPDDKLQFSAGMGHYRGKTAAAVGLFYRPDEKVMFNIGGTMGNGENLINAGITFSLDRTPRVTGSRTALTKEVVHLREHVARQDAQLALQDQQLAMQGAQIAQLTALVSQLTGKKVELPTIPQVKAPALFPDNLDNKWAYDKLEELEQQGYIRGYAGRTLSRDEFAAALDRALAGGATLEERLVKEFEPELSHVRVAHVEGKGNNEGEWYERPRASHDKLEKHEIAKKLVRVQKKEK